MTVDRTTYLGSSDAKDLVSLEPWGCRRALVYRKAGVLPDNPREEREREEATEGPMVRGVKLEPVVIAEVAQRLAVGIVPGKQAHAFHPARPWLRATPDGMVGALDSAAQDRLAALCRIELTPFQRALLGNPGIVEVKTVQSAELWRVRKTGPREDHVIQTQHQLAASGLAWALLVYLNADQWRWSFYLIPRDEAWERDSYLPACDAAWGQIQRAKVGINPADSPDLWEPFLPARLKEGSKQCRTCAWRKGCWGADYLRVLAIPTDGDAVDMGEDPAWTAAAADLLAAREIEAEAEAIKEDAEERIKALLGDRTVAEGGGVKVYWKPTVQKRLDTKALTKALPEVAAQFTKEVPMRALRVYEV